MKARLTLLLSVTLALSALPVSAALAASQLFRGPSGSYVLEYPSTLKLHMASGRACANGACRPIEQASLDGPDGSMTLAIQRDINPKHLAIREWYESLVKRPLEPATESPFSLGGRDAVRRRGLVPGTTVHSINGKEVSRSSALLADDTIFVPLNATDILTIVLRSKSGFGSGNFDRVIDSIRFSAGAP